MMTLLSFIGVAVLLTVEGRWLVAAIAGGSLTKTEEWALGFPMGAFVNALLFFLLTVSGVPLNAAMVFGGHLLIVVVAFVVSSRVVTPRTPFDTPSLRLGLLRVTWRGVSRDFNFKKNLLPTLLLLAIAIKLFYGISHALLPSYSYDTVSQWNMRAKISYEDQAIAFDRDEVRGMSKPQYPILLHSLQIVFNLPRVTLSSPANAGHIEGRWNDATANSSTLILTLTSFFSFFLLLRRFAGFSTALITLACILTIPLISIHLAQGYGDIHVLEYILLSAVLLLGGNRRLMLLSAVFVAASAWVKQEGLVFGVGPWIIILVASSTKIPRVQGSKIPNLPYFLESWRLGILASWRLGIITFLLSLPWTFFLLAKGLPLSPHGGGDFTIGWHPEGIPLAFKALFAGGSFGIHWYVVFGFLMFALLERASFAKAERASREVLRQTSGRASRFGAARLTRGELFILLWGMIAFLGALFIFLCTSNIEFLINAQTFSRTMLLPLSLLILGTLPFFYYNGSHDTEGSPRS